MDRAMYSEVIRVTTEVFRDCKASAQNATDADIVYEFQDHNNQGNKPLAFNKKKLMSHKKELRNMLVKLPHKKQRFFLEKYWFNLFGYR